MLRGIADTNVLVAAGVNPRGVCARLWEAAVGGNWRLVVSPRLLSELEDVLGREKFRRWVSIENASRYLADVRNVAQVVPDAEPPWPAATRDAKDDYLVALARSAGVDALVSGDVHLTELVDLVPAVVSPAAFLVMVREAPSRS